MTEPDPKPGRITSTGAHVAGDVNTAGGDFIGRDKYVYTRSQLEELNDYLAAAVPRYASAQMQRVLNAQSQQIIKEPYKFLASFDLEDTNFFYGRNAAAQTLYQAVTTNRLTVLHAKSGAGKTSLLNAGLAPRLLTTGLLPIYARAFQDPVQAVKRAIAPGSAGPWPDMLHRLALADFMGLVCRHLPPHVHELVLVLDQFEEFFIFWPMREQRQPFVNDLAQCYRDINLPVRFILSLRKDYYSDLASFRPYIPTIFESELLLDPMERAQAAEAITAPVTRLGNPVTYAHDLLDAILDDLGGSGMELPHLQIICTKLFEDALVAGVNTIDLPAYEDLGRAHGILGNYLNAMLAHYPGRSGTVAKAILKELVSSEATKRTLPYATLASRIEAAPSERNDTITRLIDDRLMRRDEVEGEIIYEVAHEYLIAEIKQWLDAPDIEFKQIEELLVREVINWRIYHTLIPRDRLEMIYTQRSRLGRIDDATGECLLYSALQCNFEVEEWMRCVAFSNVQPLLLLLLDNSPDIASAEARLHAVNILDSANDARAVEPLISALQDTEERMRSAAAESLGRLGDIRAVEPLILALEDADGQMRRAAAESLGRLGDTRAVEPLIAALKDSDGRTRSAAAEALGKLGDARAVEPLTVAIKNADWRMRRAAAEALGILGDARAVEPLVATLKDANTKIGEAAAEALVKLGDARAVDLLIAMLMNANEDVRSAAADVLSKLGGVAVAPLIVSLTDEAVRLPAAETLGKLGDTRAVVPLIALLRDTNERVRRAAAEALGELGDARAVEPLMVTLRDADGRMSKAAAVALGRLGDAAVEPLVATLTDADWWMRSAAAEALGELGDARAVEPLIAMLKDPDWRTRRAAAEAMGRLGDARAVKPLMLTLKDSNANVGKAAAEALGRLGDARAVELLIVLLDDADGGIRRSAIDVLGKLGDTRAVEPLIGVLQDRDDRMRNAAAEVLGKLGDARAVEPLIAILNDADWWLRGTAIEALKDIGTPEALSALDTNLRDSD